MSNESRIYRRVLIHSVYWRTINTVRRLESRKWRTRPAQGHFTTLIHFHGQNFGPARTDPHTVPPYSPCSWRQIKEKNVPVDSHQLALQDDTISGPHRLIGLQPFLPSSTHSQRPFHWIFVTRYVRYVHRNATFQIPDNPTKKMPLKKNAVENICTRQKQKIQPFDIVFFFGPNS